MGNYDVADTQEKDMDEIMHTCPFFHATNIPNCPPANLVQIGIGGWQSPRVGVQTGRSMRTTILTIDDIAEIGIDKTVEIALEVAWKGASAVFLSNEWFHSALSNLFSPRWSDRVPAVLDRFLPGG